MSPLVSWRGPELAQAAAEAAERAVAETLERAAETAAGNAPVRTGELRESIGSTPVRRSGSRTSGGLGAGARYGRFVERGTRYMSAQPFLRPAADAEFPRLAERVGEHFRRLAR